MYVPLRVRGKVIGVLGVDNRHSRAEFNHEQLSLVSTLADYAAIAIENARLYQRTDEERHKLDSILGQIEDAVIVVSPDYRLVLANRKARMLFNLEDEKIEGQPLEDVFQEEVLIDLFKDAHSEMPFITEITLEEGYVMSAHLVEIPDFGYAVTMQDISYFKELDRVKTEFVNTVSHDLRSPLTAILGYVQLLSKVGEVNTQQQEFIERVQEKVYERMISERKRQAAQFRSEGEGKKAEILGRMEKELKSIVSGAYRKAEEIRGNADAEATKIYGGAFNQDPDFYAFFETLETYKQAPYKNAFVILGTDSDYYQFLKNIPK